MSTLNERLAWARKDAGYEGPVDAARAMEISRFTYAQHENGTRGFKHASAIRYAKKFRVSLDWLLTGRGDPKRNHQKVAITQMVGAGAAIIPFPDQGHLGEVDAPEDWGSYEGAEIRGDSMPPFGDGWRIIWRPHNEGVPSECLDKLCVVDVKEGPTLVKIVRKGSKRGVWNLESWKGPLRVDVTLNWAAPIRWIVPK